MELEKLAEELCRKISYDINFFYKHHDRIFTKQKDYLVFINLMLSSIISALANQVFLKNGEMSEKEVYEYIDKICSDAKGNFKNIIELVKKQR